MSISVVMSCLSKVFFVQLLHNSNTKKSWYYKDVKEPDIAYNLEKIVESMSSTTVTLEDSIEADRIFSTLMGDDVEPRREFIEENAVYVQNLDVWEVKYG